jgi:hypothetical protein
MLANKKEKPEPELYIILKHENEIETYRCKTCGKEEKTLKQIREHIAICQ